MPKQVDRQSLLKRWSELAPKECNKSVLIDEPKSDVWAFNGDVYTESDGHFFPAILLSALIKAIRTRGWHYRLSSDETEVENEQPCAWHSAWVFPSKVYVTHRYEAMKNEPCDSLLAAYVAALEATK